MTGAGVGEPHDFLKKMKAAGDVKVYLCSQTPRVLGDTNNLIDEVDGQMGMTALLLEHAANADVQLRNVGVEGGSRIPHGYHKRISACRGMKNADEIRMRLAGYPT